MAASPRELDWVAEKIYRISDNARCETTPSGFKFVTPDDGNLSVAENNDNCQVRRVVPIMNWLKELTNLSGEMTSEFEITYLAQAIEDIRTTRLRALDG